MRGGETVSPKSRNSELPGISAGTEGLAAAMTSEAVKNRLLTNDDGAAARSAGSLPMDLTLSKMVPIPGHPQGWTWDPQNDYADDLGRGYISAGGYMQIDPSAADPWGWNQPIAAVPNPQLQQDPAVANYVEVGRQPTTVTIYGAVWDMDNDYYAFYLPAGTTVSWVYAGALSVASEIIAHPDLNAGGVVSHEGPNQYRVETTGFYFYKQARRGYSPADGTYNVPAGFPHFSCFRLDFFFRQG